MVNAAVTSTPAPVDWKAAILAGIAAGVICSVVQLALWWAFWDALPDIFYRDMRLAAAILLGTGVLPPPVTFEWGVFFGASLVHFSLSIVCSLILARVISRLQLIPALIIGAVFGLLMFIINMYGFVRLFPWFVVTRDWITLLTHLVFGVTAAGVYFLLARR